MDEQNSITSTGLYGNSSDLSQYSVFQQLPDDLSLCHAIQLKH